MLFSGEPSGRLVIQTLVDVLERIAELEARVGELEQDRADERRRHQ